MTLMRPFARRAKTAVRQKSSTAPPPSSFDEVKWNVGKTPKLFASETFPT